MTSKALLFLLLLAIATSSSYQNEREEIADLMPSIETLQPKIRHKRGIFWDFIQKIVTTGTLIADQYKDTKNTFNQVYNLINDDFTDQGPPKPTIIPTSTEAPLKIIGRNDDEVKTTTEKYRISRYEFGRILGRNFRGLKRLTDLEINDALNQTKYNIQEYQNEAKKQFSNNNAVEAKNQVKKG